MGAEESRGSGPLQHGSSRRRKRDELKPTGLCCHSPGVCRAPVHDYCAWCNARSREGGGEKAQVTNTADRAGDAWKQVTNPWDGSH